MPDLPTLTVSQAHFDRLVAAFPGADAATKATAYRAWLTNRLIERVQAVEASRIDAQSAAQKAQALAALEASLPSRVDEAPMP